MIVINVFFFKNYGELHRKGKDGEKRNLVG